MNHLTLFLLTLQLAAPTAFAETARERWGGSEVQCSHPDTLEAVTKAEVPWFKFDLSALAPSTKILHASLCNKQIDQPRDPIQIHLITGFDKQRGRPLFNDNVLALESPCHASFDATEAVKQWVKEPGKNLGLALPPPCAFKLMTAYLEIAYEGSSKLAPPQADELKAVHHDGQTFLTWRELEQFRPNPGETVWVGKFANQGGETFPEPGNGFLGSPRLQAIPLGTLRRLQMFDVFNPRAGTQDYPLKVRKSGWPDVEYRVYRHKEKITAANLKDAELLGAADPLCALDETMYRWSSHGEYYDKREVNESLIPTFCIEDGKSIPAGHAYFVSTTVEPGGRYYAVTAVRNGTENTALFSDANSLATPVEEKSGPPRPVFQYAEKNKYGYVTPTDSKDLDMQNPVTEHKYYMWVAPPLSHVPLQEPRRVYIYTAPGKEEKPGLYLDGRLAIAGFVGLSTGEDGLCYNAGRGTFRSYAECKVDYFPERYKLALIQWTARNWNVDLTRVQSSGSDTHFVIRHPELINAFWPNRPNYYQNDFDEKWNPASGSLNNRMGAPDAALTVDGHKAWDVVDMTWYLKQDPARDVPFFGCFFSQPKGSNHGAEYGWQDDPKGWAALRDARQPFVAQWGGNCISGEVQGFLYSKVRWDRPVPAFSNCSLDDSPGNGDPSDGDLSGQINGFLVWDSETSVDEADRWEMTVRLVDKAPVDTCAVDITPRHCRAFKPGAGAVLVWENKDLFSGAIVASGGITADKWGLLKIPQAIVGKGKNRIVIKKK